MNIIGADIAEEHSMNGAMESIYPLCRVGGENRR
jgi:hypothetical protein